MSVNPSTVQQYIFLKKKVSHAKSSIASLGEQAARRKRGGGIAWGLKNDHTLYQ